MEKLERYEMKWQMFQRDGKSTHTQRPDSSLRMNEEEEEEEEAALLDYYTYSYKMVFHRLRN